jgi:hypothetical protein
MTAETTEHQGQETQMAASASVAEPMRPVGSNMREIPTVTRQAAESGSPPGNSDQSAAASTSVLPFAKVNLYGYLEGLFDRARGLHFEDGVHSQFSRQLMSVVERAGVSAVEVIAALILRGKVNSSVAAESLFWLARIKQTSTYKFRLWLLETCLQSPSHLLRDSAALGLVTVGDQHSIDFLKKAAEQETLEELKADLLKAVEELQQQCRLF